MSTKTAISRETPVKDIWYYAIGEGSTSIALNGVNNFGMIFYTQILGLSAGYAGLALGISTLWDAIADPLMGHITDNTKSKYGRRHLYIFIGGILLSASFLFLWFVPATFRTSTQLLFCYLLVVNLILKTSLAIFVVPYTALGFEVCTTYDGRSKLQGIRSFFNMAINFIFGAAAWALFFQDGIAKDGSRIDGTQISSNYLTMGATLAITSLILTLLCCHFTKKYIKDSRNMIMEGNSIRYFLHDIWAILKDKYAQKIFIFLAIAQFGMILTAQLQIFAYVDFMQFSSMKKTFVHGSTMIGFALGSISIAALVKHYDKKITSYLGAGIAMLGGIMLFVVFSCGIMNPHMSANSSGLIGWVPAFTFALFQFLFWGGCGILIPLATSMIADISEINKYRTGILKDGSYSAMFAFILKASSSGALFITGFLLSFVGYVPEAQMQTLSVAKNISSVAFLGGPILIFIAILTMINYPITKKFLDKVRDENIN